MTIETKWLHAPDDLSPVFSIWEAVFMKEQGFQNEFDDTDNTCWHLLLTVDGKAAGCARIFPDEGKMWHVGRVAVLPAYRKLHLGSRLMDAVAEQVRSFGGDGMILSAQCQAVGFYQKNGFTVTSEEYMDEHCPHRDMVRLLQQDAVLEDTK